MDIKYIKITLSFKLLQLIQNNFFLYDLNVRITIFF